MKFMVAPTTGTRPEDNLILSCARTALDSERTEQIRVLLQRDVNWTYITRTASRHGVMPLLYWHLKTTYPDAVPGEILNQLRDDFHVNTARNLFLTAELLKLLDLLEARGIPAIPYKGPVLAASVYGSLALRQAGDLDLLVRRRDVLKAKELLVSQRYRPECQLPRVQEAAYVQAQYEYNLDRDDDGVRVEIHWQIVPRYFCFPLGAESVRERLQPIPLAGKEILTPCAQDLLLILCAHGAKHLWSRLGWICDVAELIGIHQQMEWEEVMERACSLGSQRLLLLGFFLARELLGTALPEKVLQRLQTDPEVRSLASQVRERLFQNDDSFPGIWESSRFHLRARERWVDRIRYGLGLALSPKAGDVTSVSLPASLFPLYYMVRPIRLAGKYGLSPSKHVS